MSTPESDRPRSIYRHMMRGSLWGLGMRLSVRSIGLVSIIILARLLEPDDFGIMAMAAITQSLLLAFSEIGVDLFLMRQAVFKRAHFDTAWTLNLLRGLLLAALLFLVAPLGADYFQEPRATDVIRLAALAVAIRGAANVGVVLFRKDLEFDKDFRFTIYNRLLAFLVTLGLVLVLQNYWALVLGSLAGAIIEVIVSYRMHPYRPRPCLEAAGEILSFAWRIVFWSVATALSGMIDSAVIGRFGDAALLGKYNIAAGVARIATVEMLTAVSRGLFPVYSKVSGNSEKFSAALTDSFAAAVALVCPIGFGLAVVAQDFTMVVLGEKWVGLADLLAWLAIYMLFQSLSQFLYSKFPIVPDGERVTSALSWLQLLLLAPTIIVAASLRGAEAVPVAAAVFAVLFFPVACETTTRVLPLTRSQIAGALWRPLLAASVMAIFVSATDNIDLTPVVSLPLKVLSGALIYVLVVYLSWILAGRPSGIESLLIQQAAKRLKARSPD